MLQRLKKAIKKLEWGKVPAFSGLVWLLSIAVFVLVIFLATGFFSAEADKTSFGQSELFVLLLLASMGIGTIAFLVMVASAVLLLTLNWKKYKKYQIRLPHNLKTRQLLLVSLIIAWSFILLFYGKSQGLEQGLQVADEKVKQVIKQKDAELVAELQKPSPSPSIVPRRPAQNTQPQTSSRRASWGGPELWESVNKRRIESGVNPLSNRSELCTIAAIRLSELRELGKLDGHEGFGNMPERRPDLKWIFEKYNVAEYLIVGYPSPEETVNAWEHTLGHRSLLAGGEWVWGCIYAQDTFGVAITGY